MGRRDLDTYKYTHPNGNFNPDTNTYKYTNSGAPGVWVPSEEFPSANRRIRVREGLVVEDRFGKP